MNDRFKFPDRAALAIFRSMDRFNIQNRGGENAFTEKLADVFAVFDTQYINASENI